jgi:hypothetical protein
MTIEIIVRAPIFEEPILQRAKLTQQLMPVSANSLSNWSVSKGWPEWTGWKLLANSRRLKGLTLDGTGYALSVRNGTPGAIVAYMGLPPITLSPFPRAVGFRTTQDVPRPARE